MDRYLAQIQAAATEAKTRLRERVEDLQGLLATPGATVVTLRYPWPVGTNGTVLGTWQEGARTVARVDFSGKVMTVPLDAISRLPGGMDCDAARIAHAAALIKLNSGGEFLE